MQNKCIILLSILFLFSFNIKIIKSSQDIIEIELTSKNNGQKTTLSKNDISKLIYIKGEIDNTKKYFLITLEDDNIDTSISITKNKDFDIYKEVYDYTFLPKEKKLALPSSYFESNNINGFYMSISLENENKDLNLTFEFLDEITLEIGEEFSFLAKNEDVENFKININGKSDKFKLKSTIGNIGFILSGGDEKQLSMNVNENKAKKLLNNIFGYWLINDLDNYSVNINVSKNVKFYFKTQLFIEEDYVDDKNLTENLYNQFYFVKNNRLECFNIEINSEDENEKDFIILSQEKFLLDIYSSLNVVNYEYFFQNSELYAISDNLKINNTINKICIKLNKENSDDFSLIQIYFYDKLNKDKITQEPLIPGIKYNYLLPKKSDSSSSSNQNINIHTHSQFFENDSDKSKILGINTIIKTLSGKIKVYQDICSTYPKCESNNNSRYKKEIYSINGLYHTLIKADSDTYSSSNRQNIFIVECKDEESDCKYEILFSDNQKKTFIRSGDLVSKYLEPYENILNSKIQDSYYTYLHSAGSKIVINLAVYSGDAYIVQINDIKGCKFEEEHFGSDERIIFHCDEDEIEETNDYIEIKNEFTVRAGKDGAVYSLYIYEQKKDNKDIYITVGTSKYETIKSNNNKYLLIEKGKGINELITLINPINCKLYLNNENIINVYSSEDFIQYMNDLKGKSFTDLLLNKSDNYNNIDKCLFYISSYSPLNEDSYLTITENKPIKFHLCNNLTNIRLQYLYGMTNGIRQIYLQINTNGNNALKIKIENINEENTNSFIVKDNKIITIMNGNNAGIKGISLNTLSRIKINVELYEKNDKLNLDDIKEANVEMKIITNLNTPNFLKSKEQLSDIMINDEYRYYVSLINKGSKANYSINLNNKNIGYIYGRLLDSDHMKENGGWNNRFILPSENTDINKLLPFDFENQRLIIEKEHTQYCNKYCYLLMAVKSHSYNKYIDFNNNIITEFNSYLKLYPEKGDSTDKIINFIKIKNNEYISSYVTDGEDEYFSFELNEYNSKLDINFECDNCIMTLVFNDTDFNSKKAQKYISNGDKKNINLGKDLDIKNSTAYIKISTLNSNENKSQENKNNNGLKYKYSLKCNSPNDIDNTYKYIDGSIPESIEFKDDKNTYYDYAVKLDTYNSEEDINIIGVPNNDNEDYNNNGINKNLKEDIEIYAKIVDDNENITIDSWPDRDNHDFPPKGEKSSNFLKIKKKDINKGENGKDDKIMLVRIYGKKNNNINLHTNYDDIDNEEEKDILIPGKYQLITVNNSNSDYSYKINLPKNLDKNKEYIYKIKKLDGKGKITYGEDEYELNDKYDTISFPIDNSIPSQNNKINIKSLNLTKDENKLYNDSFTFLIKYEEKNGFNSLEKIKIGGSKYFSTKDDTESIDHFIPLENINDDLPINVNFDTLNLSEEDEYINQIRNNTETFDLEGYLVTEDELNQIKNGNASFLRNKKDGKYNGNYYIENKHGFLNIKKNEIDKFKNNNPNKKPYLYFIMKKSKINDKNYNNIKGDINIYPANNQDVPIPEDEFYLNTIDCTKNNSHLYKLGDIFKNKNEGISDDTHNLTVDFVSPVEGLKVKIVNRTNSKDEDLDYFGITKKENDNGKDTIIITKNLDNAYLLVETPDQKLDKQDEYNTNVDYMFKYRYKNKVKDKNEKNVKYNNAITYNKMGNTDLKTNITINKIKDSNNEQIPCNYYVRIYKTKENKSQNKNLFYPKKNISLINNNEGDNLYGIYKIDSKNPILKNEAEDSFTVPIEIDTDDQVYMDIVAESVPDGQVYGYNKGYPKSDDVIDDDSGRKNNDKDNDNNKNEENNKGKIGFVKLILIIICILLLLILLIICCMKTCSCSYWEKNSKDEQAAFLPGLKDITFHTSDDEGGNNNYSVSSYY